MWDLVTRYENPNVLPKEIARPFCFQPRNARNPATKFGIYIKLTGIRRIVGFFGACMHNRTWGGRLLPLIGGKEREIKRRPAAVVVVVVDAANVGALHGCTTLAAAEKGVVW